MKPMLSSYFIIIDLIIILISVYACLDQFGWLPAIIEASGISYLLFTKEFDATVVLLVRIVFFCTIADY